MNKFHEKAIKLGYPNAILTVKFEFTIDDIVIIETSSLHGIVDRGVLIGHTGHLQLIEWEHVADIY